MNIAANKPIRLHEMVNAVKARQLVKFETSTERPVWDYLVSFHCSLLPLRSESSHHHT